LRYQANMGNPFTQNLLANKQLQIDDGHLKLKE